MAQLPNESAEAQTLADFVRAGLSKRPRVLATYAMPQAVIEQFRTFADLTVLDGINDPDALLTHCLGHDALVCTLMNRISADFVARLPAEIRLVATYSVGFDHVDVAALGARGVTLVNTPDVLTQATADVAWLLLLGAARRAWEAQSMLRAGRWQGWEPTQLVGADVHGKTLGILGFGRIGRAVAERARGFNMRVRTCVRDPAKATSIPDHVTLSGSMEEVLSEGDFVSFHLPMSSETAGWLNAKRIALMKPGAIVINTARGGLIDEAALIRALHDGQLAAAGLDVFDGEPKVSAALLAAPNTYLLPHIGSATASARTAMGLSLASEMAAFFDGRPLTCRVEAR